MKNSKLIFWALAQSLGVAAYVSAVALLMQNGEKLFGNMNNFWGPISFLLLFVLSAAITGSLTLGRPVLMFLDNRKAEAIRLFIFTLGWLFIITLFLLLLQALLLK